ncbi:MAG: hypothetical protein EZS28_050258 [Streblomastix strix]|uniref:Uncharacterized protein n=1 Tax=Streblomastix strix TaxID=222440 RepID=A0A5J4T9W2_9EUKA|nr:MAG: hypothetical protein EZS28_050258 [Streblomastix strix]
MNAYLMKKNEDVRKGLSSLTKLVQRHAVGKYELEGIYSIMIPLLGLIVYILIDVIFPFPDQKTPSQESNRQRIQWKQQQWNLHI